MTEFIIKSILSEELFGQRLCESLEDQQIVEYFYRELLLEKFLYGEPITCLLYTSPSPRDRTRSRMPSSA